MKEILQLKIVLKHTKPVIWRRVLVDIDTTFLELHYIIQEAMGWEIAHLYEFNYAKYRIGEFNEEFEDMGFGADKLIDSSSIALKDVISFEKEKIKYEYDFGDGWEHIITVEKFLEREEKLNYPVCVKAHLSCPPEDCGGVGGFYFFLEVIKDKKHPEHLEYLEWYGSFDENDVSLKEINKRLLLIGDFINERKGVVKKVNSIILEKERLLLILIQDFCNQKLNEEYFSLCKKVVFKMRNKSKVPFNRGELEIWAAAIIYAIGSINYLFDKASKPYLVSQEINNFFNTKTKTVSNKARAIKNMFDMTIFDDEFSTQQMKENNPFDNMVMVDGLITSLSSLPEELQKQVKEARGQGRDIQFFTKDDKE